MKEQMNFSLQHTDCNSKARAALITTDHGQIETPIFMPVGTQASVKTLAPRNLEEVGAQIVLGNTYHLYLRPGEKLINQFGGLHQFMNWPKPILTDSGGFQVFSLKELRKIDDEGVAFQSHLDGSYHRFTPESVFNTQRMLGSDIMMVLDECPSFPSTYEYTQKSNELTLKWASIQRELLETTKPLYGAEQWLFGIVQGSVYPDLRELSAKKLVEMDFPGYAIGGLAVGESKDDMKAMVDISVNILPERKPRYLMGVGTPLDILEGIERGIDMFDCVMPTRNARNGTVFTFQGKITIKAAKFKNDLKPIDSTCNCYCCQNFSRGYIRHLFNVNEILGMHLASLHNLHFYLDLVKTARLQILNNNFIDWKRDIIDKIESTITNES
jgi:queuine tRNA-ribosyltransferase